MLIHIEIFCLKPEYELVSVYFYNWCSNSKMVVVVVVLLLVVAVLLLLVVVVVVAFPVVLDLYLIQMDHHQGHKILLVVEFEFVMDE